MANILVVEDNESIRLLIKTRLSEKYSVFEASDGAAALSVMGKEKIDLLIVDIMMKGMNGFELVRTLRNMGNSIPVIMLTAISSMDYKQKGFELGIDDYLVKPVDCKELVWRIDAILRRLRIKRANEIRLGSLVLSKERMNASWKNGETNLTEKEFGLLSKLLSYPQTVFTKAQIMDEIWGLESETDYSTIKTYINRLRNKFESCEEFEIVSVRGLGYKAVTKENNEKITK